MPDSKPLDLYNIDWGSLTDEQRAKMDKALAEAEGVKQYVSFPAGSPQWGAAYQRLGARGGLSAEESTALSRYRAWKSGQGGDEKGLPRAPDTDEEINDRARAWQGGDETSRKQLNDAGKAIEDRRSHDNYFADITNRKAHAAAFEAERTQRNTPVGPPIEAMNPPAPTEVAPQQLAAAPQAPAQNVPMSRVAPDADPEAKLGDAQLSLFQQLANTPYSNEAVSAMAAQKAAPAPAAPAEDLSPTDAKLRDNLRMLMQYGAPRMEFTGNE